MANVYRALTYYHDHPKELRAVERVREAAVESVASTFAGADIPLFCVAGNHDHNVLPDLAEATDDVRLLGRDGNWERAILAGTDGEPRVHVDGWSFPSRYHHERPLDTYDLVDEGVPRLGVVHADVSDEDRYAPVAWTTWRRAVTRPGF